MARYIMTCYDCIHCGACSDAGDSGFSCLKEDVSKCKHFKNKADVVEVLHGEWLDKYGNKYANHLFICSVCGKEALCEYYTNELGQIKEKQALTPVCPLCGAKMDGGNHV